MWNSTFEPGLTQKSKRIRETWPWAETHLLLILSDLFFTVVRNAIIANSGLNFNPRSCFCFSEVYSLAVLILASHLEVTRTWNYMKEYTKLSLLCSVQIWIQISRYPCFEQQQTLTLSAYSEAIWEISSDWSPTMDPTVLDERAPLKKRINGQHR